MRTTSRIAVVAFAIGLGAAAVAFAGATSSGNVSVDLAGMTASGGFGGARNNSDSRQYIGCSVTTTTTQFPVIAGTCRAKNRFSLLAAASVTCTIDPNQSDSFAWVLAAMNSDSFVKFTWKVVNGANICNSIEVRNESKFEPRL